ncbi:DNA binding protein, putative [Ricinus communis]|uniref:DNA binding protein, putative n=1 Tax=Ricinus communis TaxID=3988 RepID=B9T371_RICCO|nr:DNA binding protein, putative [Ricinus communis]|eukprot:XP_002532690.1 FHA domain-containing protein At4g14490 [Ricinus communis]
MEHQSLKLVILQGPRKGEIFEFPSKSTVKIGRVVRGNNLTIKDDGISSKHLVIGPESPSSGKCIVQDLDSSNGTTLNSSTLPPFTSFVLHDGDTLKLGGETSILVQFQDSEEPSQLRRYPKRKVKESVIRATDEETENKVRRGRPRKAKVSDDKELEDVEKFNVRVTRNRKNEDRKDSEPIVVINIEEEEERESERQNVIMEKQPRRGRPVKARVSEDKQLENVGPKGEDLERKKVNSRVTRKRKNNDCALANLDGKMLSRGRGSRKNIQEVPVENLDLGLNSREDVKEQISEADNSGDQEEEKKEGLDLREELNKQVSEVSISGDEEEEKKEGLDAEIECEGVGIGIVKESVDFGWDLNEVGISRDEEKERENGSRIKESNDKVQVSESENLGKEKVRVDMKRITLGQWFDHMEYSHKQTSQAIEEIIQGMRMKAVQIKKHIIEQKKAKAMAIG